MKTDKLTSVPDARIFRSHFPFFDAHPDVVYLDSAATTHKPQQVIDTLTKSYIYSNANVHRSSYPLAAKVTAEFEHARQSVKDFINAGQAYELIWSFGATDALNQLSQGLDYTLLHGTEIVLLSSEHHANLLPWQRLAKRLDLRIKYVELLPDGQFDSNAVLDAINDETALIALAHVSNVTGIIHPVTAITGKAKLHNALVIIDGTQAVAHLDVDVQAIGCDAYVFSSHKMYGPTGIGATALSTALAQHLNPSRVGGEMVLRVTLDEVEFQPAPLKFEAGTPAIHNVLAFAQAAQFIQSTRAQAMSIEQSLMRCADAFFEAHPYIQLLGGRSTSDARSRIPLYSFSMPSQYAYDVFAQLQNQFAFRVGTHCAMPLHQSLNLDSSLRISLAPYNTVEELDAFFTRLTQCIDTDSEVVVNEVKAQSAAPASAFELESLGPIAQSIYQAQGHTAVMRAVMLSAKHCPILDEDQRIVTHFVSGCEVDVWIAKTESGWQAYANSKVVRGLIALLFEYTDLFVTQNTKINAKPSTANYQALLNALNLSHYLSQSRLSGLSGVIARLSA